MAKLTKGTQVYFIDPNGGTPQIVELTGITDLDPGTSPSSQIDITTLADQIYRQYRAGLRNPGAGSMTVHVDPDNTSHITLHNLGETHPSPIIEWAIGWSDDTSAPTLDVDDTFILPTTRTWCTYSAYISDFPFNFSIDAVVQTEIGIQRSGGLTWTPKST